MFSARFGERGSGKLLPRVSRSAAPDTLNQKSLCGYCILLSGGRRCSAAWDGDTCLSGSHRRNSKSVGGVNEEMGEAAQVRGVVLQRWQKLQRVG